MKWTQILILSLAIVSIVSCTPSKDQLGKMLSENPELLTNAIEKNPAEFVKAFQKAIKSAQSVLAKDREQDEQKKLAATFDAPLTPVIRSDEAIRGPKDAPLTLVEYSDFECPFCKRGYDTVNAMMSKYKGKIRFIYKHLPLSFHPQAMVAAKYFEAIRLQSSEKAFKFHDLLFDDQRKLKNGEKFLNSIAKKAGANLGRLKKDLNSKVVIQRIEEDQAEAAKFGMQGTPGFLLNGVPVKGAYPVSHFEGIVEELKKRGKIKL